MEEGEAFARGARHSPWGPCRQRSSTGRGRKPGTDPAVPPGACAYSSEMLCSCPNLSGAQDPGPFPNLFNNRQTLRSLLQFSPGSWNKWTQLKGHLRGIQGEEEEAIDQMNAQLPWGWSGTCVSRTLPRTLLSSPRRCPRPRDLPDTPPLSWAPLCGPSLDLLWIAVSQPVKPLRKKWSGILLSVPLKYIRF